MNLKDYFLDAMQNNYALGAFNFCNLESLQAILDTAEKIQSPVMVCVSESAIKHIGEKFLKQMIIASKQTYKVPHFFHLDHGKNFEICEKAISLGFDSVMIDASSLPLKENIALTKKVVDYAKQHNVFVEGELGRLLGKEDDHNSNENVYTLPEEAKQFVEETGVTSLAIAIGTSHGINKFTSTPELRFDILGKIQNLIPNTPLVLHGSSSVNEKVIDEINYLGGEIKKAVGVPSELLNKACKEYNVCKINVDTDIRMETTLALRKFFKENPQSVDTKTYFAYAKNNISEMLENKMTNVFNSKNKAK